MLVNKEFYVYLVNLYLVKILVKSLGIILLFLGICSAF